MRGKKGASTPAETPRPVLRLLLTCHLSLLTNCSITPLTNKIRVGEEPFVIVVGEGRDGETDLFAAPAGGEGSAHGPGLGLATARRHGLAPVRSVQGDREQEFPPCGDGPSLAAGRDKAAALRSAQLKVLAGLRAGRLQISSSGRTFTLPEDPFFWAGFVLVGEP